MSPPPAPPEKASAGEQLELAVDVKNGRPGDTVTFTVAAGGGSDVVATLSGAVSNGTAKALWTVDPGTRALPLPVAIKASLRDHIVDLGQTTIVSGARVSTLGWLDAQGRVLQIDQTAGARVAAAGDAVFLKFDVDDGQGGAVKDTLEFTFILERESGPGSFAEAGRFQDSTTGVNKFERRFDTPNDSSVPGTFHIVLETRRKGETGATPSLGRRTSPPLKVIVVAPLVTSFVGADPDTGSSHPAEQVALGPGQVVRLFWDVLGAFQSVQLTGAAPIDLKGMTRLEHDGVVSLALTADPAKDPPDADGHYTVVATNQGLDSPARQVTVVAITRFVLRLSEDQPPSKTPRTLTDAKGKKTDEIPGRAKPHADPAHKVDGEVTPRSKVNVSWKVVGAKDVKLQLKAENSRGDGLVSKDVTDTAGAGEGSFEFLDPSKGAVLDAEIAVLEDKPTKPATLARGIIHLREGFPFPELLEFTILDGAAPVAEKDGVFAVSSWANLAFRWRVNESAVRNHLELKVTSGASSFPQTLKGAKDPTLRADTKVAGGGPFDGIVTVEANLLNDPNEKQKGSRTVKLKIAPPEPPKHKLTVRVRSFNGPFQGAQVTAIDKTGTNHNSPPTPASGEVTLPAVTEGDVTVIVRAPGFKDGIKSLHLTKDDTLDVDLSPALPTNLTLEAFIKFEAWNVSTKAFEPLAGISAEAVEDGTVSTTVLDTQTTGALGVAHFQVTADKRASGKSIDLFFRAKPSGRNIGGVTFPSEWSTKGWKSPDGTQGLQKGFTGSSLGSAAAPIVFRVGVDFHLRIAYEFTPAGGGALTLASAVQGVGVELQRIGSTISLVRNVGRFSTDARGEVHGLTFLPEPGDGLRVDVDGSIENGGINLPKASFRAFLRPESGEPDFWRSEKGDPDSKLIEDNRDTSIGTQAAPAVFKGVGSLRAGAMYIFKVLSEWSQFLTHITDGLWKGISGLKIFPHTAGGTSYSFPVGHVNFEPSDFFDRATIAHELSHQIMWKESDIGSGSIVGKVLTGHLHLHHTEDLLSKEQTHPLIEGWAEFIEAIFKGSGYSVATLRDDVSKAASIPLGPPPPNRGEFCEGAFANGLFAVYTGFIGGRQVRESADGNSFEPWMDDPGVRRLWKSAIWDPLQDLRSKSPPTTRDFLSKLKSMHPADWHRIVPLLHKLNMMMDPPTVASIAPPSGPAAGTDVTVTGTEFADGGETTVEFDGTAAVPTVVDSATLRVRTPAGGPGPVNVVVVTRAGRSAAATFTRT